MSKKKLTRTFAGNYSRAHLLLQSVIAAECFAATMTLTAVLMRINEGFD